MRHRRHWIVVLALVLLAGCERTTPEPMGSTSKAPESKPAETQAKQTRSKGETREATKRATEGTKRHTTATTTSPAARRTGSIQRVVISEQRIGGTLCLVTEPAMKSVSPGDEVRWVSQAKRPITIDVNGTSPLARGHFDLAPGGTAGGVVTYDSGQLGARTFYYSVFPRNCSGAVPAIHVAAKKR